MSTDPDTVHTSARAARDSGWRRRIWIIGGILVVSIAVGAGTIVHLYMRTTDTAAQQSQAAVAAQRLADQVRQLGARPVVQPPTPVAAPPPVTVAQAPQVTQQEVDNAVDGYFAAHPPGDTPAVVAVKVAAYLTAHPPKSGPPPTPAMIATAASDYIAAHAADFQGKAGTDGANGVDGKPGQDATDAQVQSAVDTYCDTHNQCKGDQGPQGVSFVDLEFQRDDNGECQAVVTLHDPATGSDSTVTHPAGDAACQAAPPTTTDPPATTPGLLAIHH